MYVYIYIHVWLASSSSLHEVGPRSYGETDQTALYLFIYIYVEYCVILLLHLLLSRLLKGLCRATGTRCDVWRLYTCSLGSHLWQFAHVAGFIPTERYGGYPWVEKSSKCKGPATLLLSLGVALGVKDEAGNMDL